MAKPVLEMKNITKRFPGVVANDNVDLTMYPGEIHALLGENGAGKSTLMNVLTGIYAPNQGKIYYKGERVKITSPKVAVGLGISMVHQHFKLIESLSVMENLYVASDECKFHLNTNQMRQRVKECSQQFNLPVDPDAKIWQLSVGEQQRVEIVKLLFHGAELLILDEPTAVLTPQESRALFSTLRKMADDGKSILYITHKMFEVMEYSDRITVLRHGKSVGTMLTKDTDSDELTHIMVGHALDKVTATREKVFDVPQCELELKGVCANNDKGLPALRNIDLSLYRGEILGIAGVAGNGQKELCEAITGLRRVHKGTITYKGENIANAHPKTIIDKGVAYIPEDRMEVGLVGQMSMTENVILRNYKDKDVCKRGVLQYKTIQKRTDDFVARHDIKHAGTHRPVSLMSGGNIQKLLIAREVNGEPNVVVAAYPVHGVDIGATNAIHEILLNQRSKGVAVLLISEDLEELFKLSDRIAVLYEGNISGIVPSEDFSFDGVGRLMAGVTEELPIQKEEVAQ